MQTTITRDRDYPIFWLVDAQTREKMAGPFGTVQEAKRFQVEPFPPEQENLSRTDPGYLTDYYGNYGES